MPLCTPTHCQLVRSTASSHTTPAVCRQFGYRNLALGKCPLKSVATASMAVPPFASGVYGSGWRLHKGLNAQFSLSVSAGLGKHAPKGVGFGQSAAFAYVLPLNSRFSIAAGIYAANMNWGSWRQTDVGFAGVLAYRVNENINLYAYGSKTFMPRNNPFAFRHDPFPRVLRPSARPHRGSCRI